MKSLLTYFVALTLPFLAPSVAKAGVKPEIHCSTKQPAKVELHCGWRAYRHDWWMARWTKSHPVVKRVSSASISFSYAQPQRRHSLGYYRWHQRVDGRWMSQARHRLILLSYPPHHALWECIYHHEASNAPGGWYNRDTGHNGHYGGLQMHYNWGYGIVGYAYNYSELQQEWAAERGYRASGFSRTWLMGQWAHYDCLPFA